MTKYLPDAPPAWEPMTLCHLLTHTSGLGRKAADLQLKPQTDIDVIRAAYSLPLSFEPGEKWQYSNLGYVVLAEVITRSAKVSWSEYLQRRVFGPLKMTATRTTTIEEIVPNRVSGYHWMDTQTYRNAPSYPGVRPSGAFLSSVADLVRWDAALYLEGIFSTAQREMMWTAVKLNDGSEKPYGFGWEVGKTGRYRHVKHAGTMLGFRSQILRLPDRGLTVIVLANATQAVPEKIALGVAAIYLPDLKPSTSIRGVELLPAARLEGHTGLYRVGGDRLLNVTRREEKLAVTMALSLPGLGKQVADLLVGVSMDVALLTPETESRFYDQDDPRLTYVFPKDEAGNDQLVLENAEGKTLQKALKVQSAGRH